MPARRTDRAAHELLRDPVTQQLLHRTETRATADGELLPSVIDRADLDPNGKPADGVAARYEFWRNGEVLYGPAELAERIPHWRESAALHRAEQDRLFAYTMDHRAGETSVARGAAALEAFVEGR